MTPATAVPTPVTAVPGITDARALGMTGGGAVVAVSPDGRRARVTGPAEVRAVDLGP